MFSWDLCCTKQAQMNTNLNSHGKWTPHSLIHIGENYYSKIHHFKTDVTLFSGKFSTYFSISVLIIVMFSFLRAWVRSPCYFTYYLSPHYIFQEFNKIIFEFTNSWKIISVWNYWFRMFMMYVLFVFSHRMLWCMLMLNF